MILLRLKHSKRRFSKTKIKWNITCVVLKISLRKISKWLNLGLQLYKRLKIRKKTKRNQAKKKNKKSFHLRSISQLKNEKRKEIKKILSPKRDFLMKLKIKIKIGKLFSKVNNSKIKGNKRLLTHLLRWSKSSLETFIIINLVVDKSPLLFHLQLQTKPIIDQLQILLPLKKKQLQLLLFKHLKITIWKIHQFLKDLILKKLWITLRNTTKDKLK